jgi:hypothetical protein
VSDQLSVFDDMDQILIEAEERTSIELAKRREADAQPHQCNHCGEWSPNRYLWDVNHGTPNFYNMPNVCVKHWSMFTQAQWWWGHAARAWLTDHGFNLPAEQTTREKQEGQ